MDVLSLHQCAVYHREYHGVNLVLRDNHLASAAEHAGGPRLAHCLFFYRKLCWNTDLLICLPVVCDCFHAVTVELQWRPSTLQCLK